MIVTENAIEDLNNGRIGIIKIISISKIRSSKKMVRKIDKRR